MAVEIDQPRHDHEPCTVDFSIGCAGKIRPDVDDFVSGERDVSVGQINVALRRGIPGNRKIGVVDEGRRHVASR